jgi:hypothetical protein
MPPLIPAPRLPGQTARRDTEENSMRRCNCFHHRESVFSMKETRAKFNEIRANNNAILAETEGLRSGR